MKILIIEKDREFLYSFQRLLKKEDNEVLVAFDGVQGLEIIMNENVDMVISGNDVPRISVESIAEKAKNKRKSTIFIVTVESKSEFSEKLLNNRYFDAFIRLPFTPNDLFKLMEDIKKAVLKEATVKNDLIFDFSYLYLVNGEIFCKMTVYEMLILFELFEKKPFLKSKIPKIIGKNSLSEDYDDIYIKSLNSKLKLLKYRKKIIVDNNVYEVTDD